MLSHKQILRQELECKFILNVMGKRKGTEKGRLPGRKGEARDCGGDLELNPSGNSGKISYHGVRMLEYLLSNPSIPWLRTAPASASTFPGKGMQDMVRVTGRGRAAAASATNFKEGKSGSLCPPPGVRFFSNMCALCTPLSEVLLSTQARKSPWPDQKLFKDSSCVIYCSFVP